MTIVFGESAEGLLCDRDQIGVAPVVRLAEIRAPHESRGPELRDEFGHDGLRAPGRLDRLVEVVGGDLEVEIGVFREFEEPLSSRRLPECEAAVVEGHRHVGEALQRLLELVELVREDGDDDVHVQGSRPIPDGKGAMIVQPGRPFSAQGEEPDAPHAALVDPVVKICGGALRLHVERASRDETIWSGAA